MKSKRFVTWAIVILIGGFAAAIVAALAMFWPFSLGTNVSTNDVSAEQLQNCAKLMQLAFPENVVPLGIHVISWQDTVIDLKIRIARKDLAAFIASSPFASRPLDATSRHIRNDGSDQRWWNPDSVESFESGETELREGREVLRILVSYDNLDEIEVYLTWFDS